jgi:CTP:molybdopterin cytidylyltransferase MocA
MSRDLTFPQNKRAAVGQALTLAQGAMKSAHNSTLTNKFALTKSLRSAAAYALAKGVMVSAPDMPHISKTRRRARPHEY